jgi:hypothetical protein
MKLKITTIASSAIAATFLLGGAFGQVAIAHAQPSDDAANEFNNCMARVEAANPNMTSAQQSSFEKSCCAAVSGQVIVHNDGSFSACQFGHLDPPSRTPVSGSGLLTLAPNRPVPRTGLNQ